MSKGIHHITAISSDPQKTYDFYSRILGLRLVKKSVNQDDTQTYHLFFGDKLGEPGMDLTFFTFQPSRRGKNGNGLVSKISLAVPESSLAFWKKRFANHNVMHQENGSRRLSFWDEDGQNLELVGIPGLEKEGKTDVWVTQDVKAKHAVRAFYSATLSVEHKTLLDPILVYVFGYKLLKEKDNKYTYKASYASRAAYIEVIENRDAGFGVSGAGTVHHIAFRATDEAEQLELAMKVRSIGLIPTEVIDRYYFKSVYFRTPGGILFEIATDGPGFTADEKESELGKQLALPPFLEAQRADIEANLQPILQNS